MEALTLPGARLALYAGNLTWHGMAVYHFAFNPQRIIKSYTRGVRVPSKLNDLHFDITRYLGAMNAAAVMCALLRIIALVKAIRRYGARSRRSQKKADEDSNLSSEAKAKEVVRATVDKELDKLALATLFIANGSQFLCNMTFARASGRWIVGHGLDGITVFDTTFTVLNGLTLLARLRGF
ncbi:hypothetical protein DL93DRAFT_1415950 [Clavulina sp. PMI_390]|nr:hypothetical protein DL93DRAFT_1415950 [Clavulina sp. PMI_390]